MYCYKDLFEYCIVYARYIGFVLGCYRYGNLLTKKSKKINTMLNMKIPIH